MDDKNKILNIVYDHSRKLCNKDPSVIKFEGARSRVLALLTRTLLEGNWVLRALPTAKKINKVVLGFLEGKSPGGDGITYNFLQETWGFVRTSCINMVLAFGEMPNYLPT